MNIAVFSTNLSFFSPVECAMKARGHKVKFWKNDNTFSHGYQLGCLLNWCDVAFVDFCQPPLRELIVLKDNHPNILLAARMHRIEMYGELVNDEKLNWKNIDVLFCSAAHVMERFVDKRKGLSKPETIVISATNVCDPAMFPFVHRKWQEPYRIAMIGNFVPKKRQYSAIQMLYDIRCHAGDFRLDIVGNRGLWNGYGNFEYFDNCMDLIKELSLQECVTIYDSIDHSELFHFLHREHAIISNSNEEGTHTSVAEAMMTGCIPLVGPWRGAREVYPDAWHFSGTLDLIKHCLSIKNKTNDEMNEISGNIHRMAVERFGNTKIYDDMVAMLEEMADKKQKGKV